tara:strand:- start:1064 stop:1234 length:171 start_codon:yes stop_codon:yes gene_type:complete
MFLLAELVDVDEQQQTAVIVTEDNRTVQVDLWNVAGYPNPVTGAQDWIYAATNDSW